MSESMEQSLLVTREGPVARITLNRPDKLNALDTASWRKLGEIVRNLSADETVRVLVIGSAGERAFCAGADISEFETTYATLESAAEFGVIFTEALGALLDTPKPVIAEIDGVCVGGGCALIMACDLRYASDESCFAITPTKIGAVYSFADTNRLVQLVGPSLAKEMLFFAESIDAERALAAGLVNGIAERSDLAPLVAERAAKLARFSRSSLGLAKRTVNAITVGATEAEPQLSADIAQVFSSADFREGYAAFLEKRRPAFS
ncbi:enoyl-CoA hydratase-related protein [uncultured Cohaesibacter sp.]|uniref:enoyl-CoA hydratase/isomerase family protein n=1 Tax=uncultured Cohaesibacter sp. TaxID=1002546 RepID=UPI0029C7E8F6|nr:enoyl-CoA hydratase-related protein [uncultured Cohaesibacter sp.]